ncbi:hypothetical protein IPdc08_00340 [archaeon]|nr:hypothetical protein IPdc08_00340 [archaeon]
MPLNYFKKGLRALGIAESFIKGKKGRASLAGVVMRSDLIMDGFAFSDTTIGGFDATEAVIQIFSSLGRRDINIIMLNGCVISMFNIIDMGVLYSSLELPVICVTYEESLGLDRYLREQKNAKRRIEAYRRLGNREEIILKTGKNVFVRYSGMNRHEAGHILNRFTLQGSVPEPLRVARILAREIHRKFYE